MTIAEKIASRFAARALHAPVLCGLLLLLLAASIAPLAAAPSSVRSGSGRITVTTRPAGAMIYLDGQASGRAPKEIEGLGPGRYFVRLELDGYRPAEVVVDLSAAQNARTLEIEMISNSAPRTAEPAPVPARPVGSATPIPVSRPAPPPATPAPVVPAPPAVIAAPPRATPAPAPVRPVEAAPTATPAAAAAPADADEIILRLVASHLQSISDGDVDTYLRLCASKVDLYDEGVQSHEAIRRSRQKLKDRWPVYEISNLREVTVRATDRSDVRRAAVTYDWKVSNPKTGKKASGTANDLLDFKQAGGQWLIIKARQNVERSKN